MADRHYSIEEIQDRLAIEDLYDRQLAAAETFDFGSYDTTFSSDARLDLSDFGLAVCNYSEYRSWLSSMQEFMLKAQRIRGGLGLVLDGDSATSRVPVYCNVLIRSGDKKLLSKTGIYYNDRLERREEGWRIVERIEQLGWADQA